MASRKRILFYQWEAPEIVDAVLSWANNLDRCYAEAAEFDAKRAAECAADDGEESADPVRDGWVAKDGRR
jgi:hypothetical protein